jgi:putative lipoprotein
MRPIALLALAAVLVVAGCRRAPETPAPGGESAPSSAAHDTTPVPGTATLTGAVFYLQRIALPEGAEVSVTLQDVTRADAPAVEIASTTVKAEGRQVPIPFTLAYEPAKIDPSKRYSLAARISNEGELLWISDAHTQVLTQGAPADSIRVKVARVPSKDEGKIAPGESGTRGIGN